MQIKRLSPAILPKEWTAIFPVIVRSESLADIAPGRQRLVEQRRLARAALTLSARLGGVHLDRLEKAENGAPIPVNGIYWSLSHSQRFVAAIAAPHPIGIDIECCKPVSAGLSERIAAPEEWSLCVSPPAIVDFYSYWTAKEAVLKAIGVGLAGLAACRIIGYVPLQQARLRYQPTDQSFNVVFFHNGSAAVTALTAGDRNIIWVERTAEELFSQLGSAHAGRMSDSGR